MTLILMLQENMEQLLHCLIYPVSECDTNLRKSHYYRSVQAEILLYHTNFHSFLGSDTDFVGD